MLDKSKIVVYIIDVNQKKQTGDRTDGYLKTNHQATKTS
jgi:hypothetical protein